MTTPERRDVYEVVLHIAIDPGDVSTPDRWNWTSLLDMPSDADATFVRSRQVESFAVDEDGNRLPEVQQPQIPKVPATEADWPAFIEAANDYIDFIADNHPDRHRRGTELHAVLRKARLVLPDGQADNLRHLTERVLAEVFAA